MRFSLKQLEYFLAVSETKNISIASKKINISSPSISSAIAQLEEEFSIKLFIRKHASGLELTKSGEKFALAAQNIVNQSKDLYNIANNLTNNNVGNINLGCLTTLAPVIAPSSGKVKLVDYGMFFTGNTIVVDHGLGLMSIFAHLEDIFVEEGQKIKKNDPLITIESDKSSVEIPSLENGVITLLNVNIGDKVSEGDKILEVDLEDAQDSEVKKETVEPKIIKKFRGLKILISLSKNYISLSRKFFRNSVVDYFITF